MNHLQKTGQRKTILISISILLISLHTIYFYNSVVPEVETKKIIQQILRFLFTVGLLALIYNGKNWARIVAIVLFSIGILTAIFGLFFVQPSIYNQIPLLVIIFVYSMAIYHFGFSKSFKAFSEYQKEKEGL